MGSEQNETVPEVNESIVGTCDRNCLKCTNISANGFVSELNLDNGSDKVIGPPSNLHKVPCIYRQDIVRHKKSGAIGIVNEVAGDSNSDSDSDSDGSIDEDKDEDDDNEDDLDEGEDDEGGDEEGNADPNTSGDKNEEGGNYKHDTLQQDHVRVLWMDDTEPVQHINDITVIDRGFLHGDYVASSSDPTGQVGIVQDVNLYVDLLASDGFIVKDVSSKDIKRVREFVVGDYVVCGPWLGRVDDVLDNVTVLVDDGSVCKVMSAEPLRLKPISKSLFNDDEHCPYYPGQRVRASSSSVFKNSRWLSGLWKANRLEGTVMKVTIASVFVYWIASAGYGPDSSTSPAEEQNPKNLKLLSSFAHANWQVDDWCLLPPSIIQSSSISLDKSLSKLGIHDLRRDEIDGESEEVTSEKLDENNEAMDVDQVVTTEGNEGEVGNNTLNGSSTHISSSSVSKEHVHESRPLHRKKICKVVIKREKKPRKKEETFERALLIVKTRTLVDVAWQDGTIEHGMDSTSLISIENPGDHEFVAEQYVVEKASNDADDVSEVKSVGVVKSVNAKERTACVRWLKPISRPEDPREFDKEEIVSVYELQEHPDYDYVYGDVVVRLSPVSISGQTETDSLNHTGSTASDGTCIDYSDLSWVGNVTGLRNGDIEVTWADGMVSTVGPQATIVVGRDDDDDSMVAGSEVSDDAASWETVNDDNEMDDGNTPEEGMLHSIFNMNSETEGSIDTDISGRSSALSLPLAAFGFVTRLASGIFSRGWKHEDADSLDSEYEGEHQSQEAACIPEDKDSSDECSFKKTNLKDECGFQMNDEKGDDHVAMEALVSQNEVANLRTEASNGPASLEEDCCNFRRFDIANNPVDHYFLGSNAEISNGRKWLKKVQQEWSILQNNLPDGIFVRVYEDRMDLIRAVIVGAYGTPYQDGLFFFDFLLPPEYPDVPPSAYYHSGGWRVNPNLYEEGKVCLSLLNTWTGRGNEVWDPKSSSILQVLVSLQGLVLNSRPYFNEAGYDKQIGTAEGEKNSLSYNENTYLLNCKTMMYLMRKPPKDFGDLVKEHFRRRGFYILKACDAYSKGSSIGSLTKDASVSNGNDTNSTSVGFKLMLAKIVPKLYLALCDIGADCQPFKHLLQS